MRYDRRCILDEVYCALIQGQFVFGDKKIDSDQKISKVFFLLISRPGALEFPVKWLMECLNHWRS